MSYPPDPLEYAVEMFLNGGWRDITTDVLGDPGIFIKRGRSDQASNPAPSAGNFALNNGVNGGNGDYSPRWPTGQWYGSIGKNTPVRVAVVVARDAFGRTVSSGWGSADTDQAWTSGGSGGSVLASDHNVGGGVATQSVPATNAYRYDYLAGVTQQCVDVRLDVSLSFTNVTGASVYPGGIMLRGQSTSSYYLVRVEVTTAEAITIGIFDNAGATIAAAVTVAGLTHSSSQTLRVRAQTEGHTVRGKVWAASGLEPYGWHITAHDETIQVAGFAGVRSGVATSNSNTLPVVFSIDNVVVKVPLVATEISDMPAGWDISGNFVTAQVTSNGPLRRIGSSGSLQSALRRGYLRDLTHPPIAYWPCEDEAASTFFAPAISNIPMFITNGAPTFAALTPFDCSAALPAINLSSWFAQVPAYAPARCQVRFLVSIPSAGLGIGLRRMMMVNFAGGSIGNISVFVDQSGNASIIVYDTNLTFIYNSGAVAAGLNGVPSQIAIEFEQTTATNVNVNLITLAPGAGSVIQINPAGANMPATQTIGIAQSIVVDPDLLMPSDVAMGHFSFHTTSETLLNLSTQLNAWKTETAGARAKRLGEEERFPVSYIGSLANSEPMGPQTNISLLKLLVECAVADRGELYETRGELGLTYRTRASLYNQAAAATFDYGAGQLAYPFTSVDDDQYLKNDVTVTRQGGASARRTLETGKLSVLPPELGGVGRYDQTLTVNVYADSQLADLAGWLLLLGTVDEARYPVINLDLANSHLVSAGLQDVVMDLEIGVRMVVANPKAGQTADEISQLIVGYEIQLRRFMFVVKYNCVPESPYQVGVLDDTDKRLDSDTTTLTSGFTSSATSFQVSISSGALWTTSGTHLPVKIKVGGEIMSVGAVSGTSSPQTFSSVTRSVNGVVKAHVAGEEVHVAYPFVLPM